MRNAERGTKGEWGMRNAENVELKNPRYFRIPQSAFPLGSGFRTPRSEF
jgi:hypothetical protein